MYVNIGYYDVAQKRAVLYCIRKAPDSYVAAAAREVLREIAKRTRLFEPGKDGADD
jgi:hypothetical protein